MLLALLLLQWWSGRRRRRRKNNSCEFFKMFSDYWTPATTIPEHLKTVTQEDWVSLSSHLKNNKYRLDLLSSRRSKKKTTNDDENRFPSSLPPSLHRQPAELNSHDFCEKESKKRMVAMFSYNTRSIAIKPHKNHRCCCCLLLPFFFGPFNRSYGRCPRDCPLNYTLATQRPKKGPNRSINK